MVKAALFPTKERNLQIFTQIFLGGGGSSGCRTGLRIDVFLGKASVWTKLGRWFGCRVRCHDTFTKVLWARYQTPKLSCRALDSSFCLLYSCFCSYAGGISSSILSVTPKRIKLTSSVTCVKVYPPASLTEGEKVQLLICDSQRNYKTEYKNA